MTRFAQTHQNITTFRREGMVIASSGGSYELKGASLRGLCVAWYEWKGSDAMSGGMSKTYWALMGASAVAAIAVASALQFRGAEGVTGQSRMGGAVGPSPYASSAEPGVGYDSAGHCESETPALASILATQALGCCQGQKTGPRCPMSAKGDVSQAKPALGHCESHPAEEIGSGASGDQCDSTTPEHHH
ncbi:MAG: hypothetical protein HUU46_13840 [Candidatus Hydrogenedentes bacterium]|nr:hypothetical protein [Candidatus Hydrogenedentota bacterium]